MAETNQQTLNPHRDRVEIQALRRYRKARAAETEKMESLLKAIDSDGRIRTVYNPIGAITGRMSASEPNIQQVPRTDKSDIRFAFTASPGRKLVKADWCAMELRAAASYVDEKTMLQLFAEGRDAHTRTASAIFEKAEEDVSGEERSIAKTTNFNLVYGGSAENLMMIINGDGDFISLEDAEFIKARWFQLYPVFKAWHNQSWDEAKASELKEVRTRLGHRRVFHSSLATHKIVYTALNFPIQGECAEALKFVVDQLYRKLPKTAHIVALLHDEIVVECGESDAEEVLALTTGKMEEIASIIFSRVHMKAEGSIRDTWG